jgi:hypothetical protein
MTELKTELRRKVRCNSSWLKGSEVVLIIYPHGELGFREPRRRAEYRLSLNEAFRQAVLITTNKINARVKELRKQGQMLGKARKQARKELL